MAAMGAQHDGSPDPKDATNIDEMQAAIRQLPGSQRDGVVAKLVLKAIEMSSSSHYWGGALGTYHFPKKEGQSATDPVDIPVVFHISGNGVEASEKAVAAWNESPYINMIATYGDASETARQECTPKDGTMQVCNAEYGKTGWAGIMSIDLVEGSSHIRSATAKLNDSYDMPQGYQNKVQCQEVGHGLSLNHTSTDGTSQNTCMDYSNDTSPTGQRPNPNDFAALSHTYSHIDAAIPEAQEANAALFDLSANSPYGRLVMEKNNQRIYLKQTNGGRRTITYMTLAPEGQ